MAALQVPDPRFEDVVRKSFARQRVMGLIGARLGRVEPGDVEIELGFREELVQQDGFLHAGVLATVADSAGGYAALTLLPPDHEVLTAEFRLHFLRPATAKRFLARGRVVKAGRTLTVCEIEVVDPAGQRCVWGSQTVVPRTLGD